MKGNINLLSFYTKRFQSRPAENIGAWKGITELLSFGSIACNLSIIYFTSNELTSIMPHYTKLEQFMLIVMIEHILLATKMLLQNMIRDEPAWIASLKYQERQEADSIKKRLD